MNQYETVFIITPVLSDDQVKETVSKFRKILTEGGAEITEEENWGLRKLAYPIKHKTTGFYYLIEFKSVGSLIDKLETEFRRDEKIIRHLTIKMDKHAIAYSDKKKKLKSSKTNS
ncbi:MAG: 30S ribosomal protein S6 [Bacteroidia bacterium]|nr:MAG: 30S ribosomal protein S6 [Bacteroidia bacterium]